MSLSVILDGTELNGPHSRFGFLEVDDIDGWFNPPARKQRQSSRENADGDYLAPSFYEARYITINGALAAIGAESRWTWTDYLAGLLDGGQKKLTIRIDGQVQWAMVESTSQPETDVVAHRLIEYQLSLKSIDPYKYGEFHDPEGAVGAPLKVHQYGNTPAWPVAKVQGSFPGGYRLAIGGRTVEVTRPLTSGAVHTLDLRTGILKENGTRVMGGIGQADYFRVPKGQSGTLASSPITTGSGTVRLEYRDTYI